ncbi:DUF4238 domain-containing protein [Sinomonas gamaensis]|uniref:DUF4238 domain-containing protein n=1 Tax=Sinomonas gamaensis TaxID=2565624 RepID=UPI001107EF83|nr:DUF4238 domain-containing protein [Sinomonas gamaensis]
MTANGQESRRHHLVPRFYLDRWAINNRLRVTDLSTRRSFTAAPINALIETDYYRVPDGAVDGGSPVVWETWLSDLEGRAAKVFEAIDSDGLGSLDDTQWGHLLHFIGVQITRSRSHRYQGRWMMGAGQYQLWELHRPGAIEAMLTRAGEEPTPERVGQIERYFAAAIADPWSVPMLAEQEMVMAIQGASVLAEVLSSRQFVLYSTAKPLLTGDEPVVQIYERMGDDHPNGGGYFGAPVIVFPLGPHQALAMFRSNMPVPHGRELNAYETIELNQVIAANAHRHIVEQPGGQLGTRLRVPDLKEPARIVNVPPANGEGAELVWMPAQRRWHGEPDAPIRPVKSWWPVVVPPAPRPPAGWRTEAAR